MVGECGAESCLSTLLPSASCLQSLPLPQIGWAQMEILHSEAGGMLLLSCTNFRLYDSTNSCDIRECVHAGNQG